jgi:hypothetical protein
MSYNGYTMARDRLFIPLLQHCTIENTSYKVCKDLGNLAYD